MQPATSIPPPGGPPLGYDPNYDPLADLTNTMKQMLEQMKHVMELSLQGIYITKVIIKALHYIFFKSASLVTCTGNELSHCKQLVGSIGLHPEKLVSLVCRN
jgi:hypothetical protein